MKVISREETQLLTIRYLQGLIRDIEDGMTEVEESEFSWDRLTDPLICANPISAELKIHLRLTQWAIPDGPNTRWDRERKAR